MKTEISAAQFRASIQEAMRNYRLVLDCGHRFCFHPFSNTMVVHPDGLMECSNCYDSMRVSRMAEFNPAIEKPVLFPVATVTQHIKEGGLSMSRNSEQIGIISVYIPVKKKSMTCYVTTENIKNVMKLFEEALMLEKKEVEALNGKAPEAATSEAISE